MGALLAEMCKCLGYEIRNFLKERELMKEREQKMKEREQKKMMKMAKRS